MKTVKNKEDKPLWTDLSPNELRLDYKGNKFMLIEQKRGVYGGGKAIQLYLMKGFEKEHIKEIGWTQSDGYCKGIEDACINELTNMSFCKNAAIEYINKLL
jgi:hypothetical protein